MNSTQPSKKKENVLVRAVRQTFKFAGDVAEFYLKLSLITTSFSLLLQLTPRLVSTPLQEHMKQQGYNDNIKDDFKAAEISVYKRGNILVPFHMMGRGLINQFNDNALPGSQYETDVPQALLSSISGVLHSPQIALSFANATVISDDNAMNALTVVASKTALEDRHIFIYPAAKVSARKYMADFGSITETEAKKYQIKGDTVALADIFYKSIMYHECRHGDQFQMETIQHECDADIFALRKLHATEPDKKTLQEFSDYWIASRAIRGIYGDNTHATALALLSDSNNSIGHLLQGQANKELYDWLDVARSANKKLFNEGSIFFNTEKDQNYYLLSVLAASGKVKDSYTNKTINTFLASCSFLADKCDSPVLYNSKIHKLATPDLSKLHIPAYPIKPSAAPSPAAP